MWWTARVIWCFLFQVFVFVSTAYSQPHGIVLEEKYYPSKIEPQLMDKVVEKIDPDILDAISPKWTSPLATHGCHYSPSCIAESWASTRTRTASPRAFPRIWFTSTARNSQSLWLGRRSVCPKFNRCRSRSLKTHFHSVIQAWKEPMKGFTEGMHGINGWCIAVGRGVLRTMHCQHDYPCNVIPADITVNGIVVLAYERGKNT